MPRLSEILDARSADWGTPWFPVLAEHPRLRVGPLVVPGVEYLGQSRHLPPGGEDAQFRVGPACGQLQRASGVRGDLDVAVFTTQPLGDGRTELADGEYVDLGH
jgi:hypothetical protein